jgi:hypothetical protein
MSEDAVKNREGAISYRCDALSLYVDEQENHYNHSHELPAVDCAPHACGTRGRRPG